MKTYQCNQCEEFKCKLTTRLTIYPNCPGGLDLMRKWEEAPTETSESASSESPSSVIDVIALAARFVAEDPNDFNRRVSCMISCGGSGNSTSSANRFPILTIKKE